MKNKNYLSEAIIISAIPVVAYAFVYFFEYGYLSKFGLPDFLISVSIERFFFAMSSIIGLVIFWVSTVNYLMIMLSDVSFRYMRLVLSSFSLLIFPLLALYQLTFAQITTFTTIMASVSLVGIFFVYVLPWFETRNFKDWLSSVDEADDEEWERSQKGLHVRASKKIGKGNYLTIIVCIFVLPFISIHFGKKSAEKQKNFIATYIKNKEYALIRIYGDKGLFVEAYPKWRSLYKYEYKFKSEYVITNPSQDERVFFTRVSYKP